MSENLELPSRESLHNAIKFGVFKWMSPFNTTTLISHLHNRHFNVIIGLQKDEALQSGDPVEESILGSCLAVGGVPRIDTLDNIPSLKIPVRSEIASTVMRDGASSSSSYSQIIEYRLRILRFLIANNLPFVVIHSPTFKSVITYLKENSPGSINRHTIKDLLHDLNCSEMQLLKNIIAKNGSGFTLLMDEWYSSDNCGFFAVTLYLYIDSHKIKTYTIGLEHLKESTSCTDKTLFVMKSCKTRALNQNSSESQEIGSYTVR